MRRALADSHWDVVVVGAGLGGLSAAAALTRRGLRVLVLEQHDVPGGYAHRFLRRPRGSDVVYAFDVALHQIGGLAPGRLLAENLRALGVLERIRLRRFDVVYRTRGPAHDLRVSADVTRYQQQLADLFPEHRAGIGELFHQLGETDLGVVGFREPSAASLRWLGRTLKEVVRDLVPDERFLMVFSPLWGYLGLPPAALCAFTFAQMWASYHLGGCFYIQGGGQALSNAFVDIIETGGGQVLLNASVTQILTSGGHVSGVATGRHGVVHAPVVVSNASAPDTFERLLDDPRLALADRRTVAQMPTSISILESYVGMRGSAQELGLHDRLIFDAPSYDSDAQWAALLRGDLVGVPSVVANHNLSDPDGVPAGRSILNAAVLAPGAGWAELDAEAYAARKRAAEAHLLDLLDSHVPGIRERVEVCETGTPRTMSRYSWNPDGAIYGIPASPKSHPLRRPRARTGVAGLFLAGAWTFPAGGFHGAMTSGLHTAELVSEELR